jgi:F-type H+-transporting ATPase subunit b
MHFSWFTLVAQILNFLILVWLLKRVLYKPILDAVEEREKRISGQLADVEARKAEAGRERDEFRQKNNDFDQKRSELMRQVTTEAQENRQKLLGQVREEANGLRSNMERALKELRQDLNGEITHRIEQEVFAITRKALEDLASNDLETLTVKTFVKRLNGLKDEERKQLLSAFQLNAKPILVRSAFDLSDGLQQSIRESVDGILGTKGQYLFETKPELISGIEFISNGYKLSWNITEYLKTFENAMSEVTKEKVMSEPK